jgi:hypothetical protein
MAGGQHPFVTAVLRSPLHGMLSKSLMLLTVTGRMSGRSFTFPVQYVREGKEVLVLAGRAEGKTWWRNLLEPAPVLMRIRGHEVSGTAHATRDPEEVSEGLRVYLLRFPRAAKSLGVPAPRDGAVDAEALDRIAAREVIVRISVS